MKLPTPAGTLLVFRYQMQNRHSYRDLLAMLLLLAGTFALSLPLQRYGLGNNPVEDKQKAHLASWLITQMIAGALTLPLVAALLGARAVPAKEEFEITQSALLSRLTAFDIVEGRLLAGLWPLITTVLASCALWLTLQVIYRFLPENRGYLMLLIAHFTLLAVLSMAGSIAFLCAERRRPGRTLSTGVVAGLVWTAAGAASFLLINPLVSLLSGWGRGLEKAAFLKLLASRLQEPGFGVGMALLVNPVVAVASALDLDILRTDALYDRTVAPEYLFAYPPSLASAGLFLAVSLLAKALAARRLRLAYR